MDKVRLKTKSKEADVVLDGRYLYMSKFGQIMITKDMGIAEFDNGAILIFRKDDLEDLFAVKKVKD